MTKTIKKVNEVSVPETKTEIASTPPAAVSPPALIVEGEGEQFQYFGPDSTSNMQVTELNIVDIENDHSDALKLWEKKLSKSKADEKAAIIAEGIELAMRVTKDTNTMINLMAKNLAERAIIIGIIFNHLKKYVTVSDVPWVVWAEKNLAFLGKRNRERYMMLAKRIDCYPYTFLGIDRLEMLCSATKNSHEKNPIGKLLRSHKITFDPEAETNLAEFKTKIDAVLGYERLQKKGLDIDFKLIVNLLYVGGEVDNSLIKTLSNIQECGGDTTKHIKKLLLSGGKDAADSDETKNKPADFNSLSNRLIQTIDYLIDGCSKQTVSIDQLDRESFLLLLEKLEELNKVANLTDEEAGAEAEDTEAE